MTDVLRHPTMKSWTHFFQAIKAGQKLHDLRYKGDREFHVGQHLILQEYDPFKGRYTGDEVEVEVTFITDDVTPCAFSSAILPKDYCILSIKLIVPEQKAVSLAEAVSPFFAQKPILVGDGVDRNGKHF
jgi:hypothetical protein